MSDNERVIALLEELVAWTRFSAREGLSSQLRQLLADPRHYKAYESMDGTRSQRQIGAEANLSQSVISGLGQRWRRLGLVQERDGKLLHLVQPADLGIEISEEQAQGKHNTSPGRLAKEDDSDEA